MSQTGPNVGGLLLGAVGILLLLGCMFLPAARPLLARFGRSAVRAVDGVVLALLAGCVAAFVLARTAGPVWHANGEEAAAVLLAVAIVASPLALRLRILEASIVGLDG